jgi:hypothetical protein
MSITPPKFLALAALGLSLAFAAPATAASAPKSCPPHRGTIVKKSLGRVWHSGHSLYGCTVVYGQRPRSVRLGPWAPGSKVAFDGVSAAWTTPLVRNGERSDRVWMATAQGSGKRWLGGSRLVPVAGDLPAHDARIQRILQVDQGAAWITRTGEVVLALASPAGDPTAIGIPQVTLAADHRLLLLGRWTGVSASKLAATAKLTEASGDGDECGGVNPYTLTMQPDPSAPAAGVTWDGYWERLNCG